MPCDTLHLIFDGSPLPLMLTAGALFDIYDRFGVHDSILRATGAMEDTPQGWMACCELAELLMQQAALWRRAAGLCRPQAGHELAVALSGPGSGPNRRAAGHCAGLLPGSALRRGRRGGQLSPGGPRG